MRAGRRRDEGTGKGEGTKQEKEDEVDTREAERIEERERAARS